MPISNTSNLKDALLYVVDNYNRFKGYNTLKGENIPENLNKEQRSELSSVKGRELGKERTSLRGVLKQYTPDNFKIDVLGSYVKFTPYIVFLPVKHKTSSGFYVIYEIYQDRIVLKLGYSNDSPTNEPEGNLISLYKQININEVNKRDDKYGMPYIEYGLESFREKDNTVIVDDFNNFINNLANFANNNNQAILRSLKVVREKQKELQRKNNGKEKKRIKKTSLPYEKQHEENKPNNIMSEKINIILYGPPGTGKTYKTIDIAAKIISDNQTISSEYLKKVLDNDDEHDINSKIFKANLNQRIFFVSFHQNYSYEEFVGGIRPELKQKEVENAKSTPPPENEKKSNNINFEWKPGIFFKACAAAFHYATRNDEYSDETHFNVYQSFLNEIKYNEKTGMYHQEEYFKEESTTTTESTISTATNTQAEPSTPARIKDKKVVLVLDEINRANISRVFGELITLIEDDKRFGGKHSLVLKLPNGDNFTVPKNLVIIGTMNTADRSIAFIDVALRRRFYFHSLYPIEEKITDGTKKGIMEILNKFIVDKRGIDFAIGHSYFLNENSVKNILNESIIPLLMEYFPNKITKKYLEDIFKEKTTSNGNTFKLDIDDTKYVPIINEITMDTKS